MKTLKHCKKLCTKWCNIFDFRAPKIHYTPNISIMGFLAYFSASDYSITVSDNFLKLEEYEFYLHLFHELGHAYYLHHYKTIKQKIKAEKQAEKFALKQLKKYFPLYYFQIIPCRKSLLKTLKKVHKKYVHLQPHYYAYKQIKEYR